MRRGEVSTLGRDSRVRSAARRRTREGSLDDSRVAPFSDTQEAIALSACLADESPHFGANECRLHELAFYRTEYLQHGRSREARAPFRIRRHDLSSGVQEVPAQRIDRSHEGAVTSHRLDVP